jgi:hypothetical protein
MEVRETGKSTFFTAAAIPFAAVCAVFLAACLLGAGIIAFGAGSSSQIFAIGALVFVAIGAIACIVLELHVIAFVRFAFIASFFFKGEVNFYKINEIEDPSGFNLSLTLLTGLILFLYDQFVADETEEKLFPTSFSILLTALFICAGVSVLYGGSTMLGWFSLWSFVT